MGAPFRNHHCCESLGWLFFVAHCHPRVTRTTRRGTQPCLGVGEAKPRGDGSLTGGGSSLLWQITANKDVQQLCVRPTGSDSPSPAHSSSISQAAGGLRASPHPCLTSLHLPPSPVPVSTFFLQGPPVRLASLCLSPPGGTQSISLNILPCAGLGVSGKENSSEKTRPRGQPGRDLPPAAWGPALGEPPAGSQLLRAPSRGPRPLEGHEPGAAGVHPPGSGTASPGEAGACPPHPPTPRALRWGPVLPATFLKHLVIATVTLGPRSCPQGVCVLVRGGQALGRGGGWGRG